MKQKDHNCDEYICGRYNFEWHCLICVPEENAHTALDYDDIMNEANALADAAKYDMIQENTGCTDDF